MRALAADPHDAQRIYLGTGDGILFRSDDGGVAWHALRPGFPLRGCSLDQIAIDAHGAVFVGYWEVRGSGGGVAKSVDGGRTFTVSQGIAGESVRALAIAPSDPQVIAAGTRTGVFLSHRGGLEWTRVTPVDDPDLRDVEALAFDPTDPQVLYAGTRHLAWKTLDGGAEWKPVHEGMIDDSDVMTLAVDRQNPQAVYATACTGIYRSAEGGARWAKLPGIPYSSRRTRAFVTGGDDAMLLLAGTTEGLWISEDGGDRWRPGTPANLVVNAVLVRPDGAIVLGTEGAGVLRSTDRGRTWTASNAGFSDRFVSRLLFDAAGRRLFATAWGDDGVFATSGASEPWIRLGEGLDGRRVLSLASLGDTILAGTDDGIFARRVGATAWTRRPTVLDGREIHPRVSELIAMPPRRLLAATANGVLESPDGGMSWTRPQLGGGDPVFGLAVLPGDPDRIVAATSSGFYRSTKGGGPWSRIAPALPGAIPHAFAVVPGAKCALLATTTGGLFRSDDGAVTWRCVAGGLPRSDLCGIAVHPDGRTIYVSDFDWGGIFRSLDGGATWRRMPTGDLPSDRVWALGIDPGAPDRLLASSPSGLYLLAPVPVPDVATAEP